MKTYFVAGHFVFIELGAAALKCGVLKMDTFVHGNC